MKRLAFTKFAVVIVCAAAVAVVGYSALDSGPGSVRSTHPMATAPVMRTDLASRQQVAGTLGYQPIAALVSQHAATALTQLPVSGGVIGRGEMLYEVDGQPVRLLYGAHAAWRTLKLGVDDGLDVTQLKRNLIALGYASSTTMTINDEFDTATAAAVERWQTAQGMPSTGVLRLGSIAFLPGAVRVSAPLAVVGAPVTPGAPILSLSSPNLTVTVALDPTLRQLVHRGDRVSIQLPAGNQTAGRVSYVAAETTTSSPSGQAQSSAPDQGGSSSPAPAVNVTVSLRHPGADRGLDQVPVAVEITDAVRRGVLAVPVGALLALAEGGYAVAVYDHGKRTLVSVHTGVFDGGRVEVTGPGLSAGMQVEVPSS